MYNPTIFKSVSYLANRLFGINVICTTQFNSNVIFKFDYMLCLKIYPQICSDNLFLKLNNKSFLELENTPFTRDLLKGGPNDDIPHVSVSNFLTYFGLDHVSINSMSGDYKCDAFGGAEGTDVRVGLMLDKSHEHARVLELFKLVLQQDLAEIGCDDCEVSVVGSELQITRSNVFDLMPHVKVFSEFLCMFKTSLYHSMSDTTFSIKLHGAPYNG